MQAKLLRQGPDGRFRKGLRKYGATYLALTPFFLLFICFILIPMIEGMAMSFTDWSTSSKGEINFVGFENYANLFSGKGSASKRYLTSLTNLLIYAIMKSCFHISTFFTQVIMQIFSSTAF